MVLDSDGVWLILINLLLVKVFNSGLKYLDRLRKTMGNLCNQIGFHSLASYWYILIRTRTELTWLYFNIRRHDCLLARTLCILTSEIKHLLVWRRNYWNGKISISWIISQKLHIYTCVNISYQQISKIYFRIC